MAHESTPFGQEGDAIHRGVCELWRAFGLPLEDGPATTKLLTEVSYSVQQRSATVSGPIGIRVAHEREALLLAASDDAPEGWQVMLRRAKSEATGEDKELVSSVLQSCLSEDLGRASWGLRLLEVYTPRQRLIHLGWLAGLVALQNMASEHSKRVWMLENAEGCGLVQGSQAASRVNAEGG